MEERERVRSFIKKTYQEGKRKKQKNKSKPKSKKIDQQGETKRQQPPRRDTR